MRLILVRHGDSDHGQAGRIQGRAGGMGLTGLGIRQAESLATRFHATSEVRGARLLSSPMARACQTADLLMGSLQASSYEIDSELCEIFAGEAEGLSNEDYRQRYGEFSLTAFPQRPFSPGGESWDGFLDRVWNVHERFAARYPDDTIVAVTHAGFIVASFFKMFGILRPGMGAWIDPQHTALTEWKYADRVWKLVRYNDWAHCLPHGDGSGETPQGGSIC
jgi:broad specificity phosphatase PhoE